MRFKTRYKFWHILVGIISIGILYMIMHSISNSVGAEKTVAEKVSTPKTEKSDGFVSPLFMFLYIVTFFYFTLNYYYNFIAGPRKFFTFLKLTGAIVFVAFIYHTFLYYNFPQALQGKYDSADDMYSAMMEGIIPMLIASFIFACMTYLWEAQKQRRILEAQKLQLEAQISQANFNFLKAQINPHFLHNTLNFLYAKSLPYSSELSEGILTLSDIMRYALNQGNQKDGKALLSDEIEHVHNVIKISQLRYSNQLKVNFEVAGTVNGARIIPFVLITLVENAFKHGDLKSQDHPIDIKLNVKGNKLYFYCSNKKKSGGAKQPSTGIGLENIKKRLELAYGDKHKFIVKDEQEFYTTELTIEQL